MDKNSIEATKIPFQYSALGQLLKKFLHTGLGARVGFYIGLKGFNRIEATQFKFLRFLNEGDRILPGEMPRVWERTDERGNVVERRMAAYKYVGTRFAFSFNSRVDAGAALTASLLSGTTLGGLTSPLPAKYIALSTSSLTPAKTDTTLLGETAASGLARALGAAGSYVAPSVLDGAASYILSKTFTNTSAGSVTILSAAIFDAVSTGNMFVEGNLSTSAVLAINDQITINWTVNH